MGENNIETTVINYLETPPSKQELQKILNLLGKEPQELIRFSEAIAKELSLTKNDKRDNNKWIELMVNNPSLIQRPIVVIDDKAVLGRPPGNVLSLITSTNK